MARPLVTTDLNLEVGTAPSDRVNKLINETGVGLEWNSKVVRTGMFDAGGRLTLETGVPISTTNQTAKTLLYYTPYIGNVITLYSAAIGWVPVAFAELSLNVTAASPATSRPFDVWVYNNAGTATMEITSWGSATSRSTALAYQDHVFVKSGDATRRYVGSVYWNGSSQMEDSLSTGGVWNYYNRIWRPVYVTPSTNSWNYSTDSVWRQSEGVTTNQINVLCGVVEDSIKLSTVSIASTDQPVDISTGIGIDTSTASSAAISQYSQVATGDTQTCSSVLEAYQLLGYRTYRWLEYVANPSAGTITWYGDQNKPTAVQSGIWGQYPR